MNTSTSTSQSEFLAGRGAVFVDGDPSPSHFGDVASELQAIQNSAAILDRTHATCIVHEGADALDLLHRLSTHDVLDLKPGESRFTVLTSERGRIIDLLQIVMLATDRLLLLSDSSRPGQVLEWLDKFTIIEDATARNASSEFARIALIGPQALEIAQRAGLSAESANLAEPESDVIATSSEWGASTRTDLAVPHSTFSTTWDSLVDAGASAVGESAFDTARAANGVPASDHELSEDANPLEAGLKHLVSFTKGCYIGQEVVARLDTYDKLQRRLAKLESDSPLKPGLKLTVDGKRAGVVTTSGFLPVDGKFHALGFVRRDAWNDGSVLESDGGSVTVRALPDRSPVG